MSPKIRILADIARTMFESAVNLALDTLMPPRRPTAIPILSMAEREWARAAAARRQLGRR